MGIRAGRCTMPKERALQRKVLYVPSIDTPLEPLTKVGSYRGKSYKSKLAQENQNNSKAHRALRINAILQREEYKEKNPFVK